MIRQFAALAIFGPWVAAAHAQSSIAPLILVTPLQMHQSATSLGGGGPGYVPGIVANALVGGFIDTWLTGRGTKYMGDFRQLTSGTKWDDLAAGMFACVGIPQGQKCRDVLKFNGDDTDLSAKLHDAGSSQAIVIVMLQQFDGKRYRAYATLRDVELGPKAPKVSRTFTAIYSSETPDAVSDEAKGDANKLRDYWTGGTSPVLEQEGRASLSQLAGMLSALFAADHEDRRAPDGWKDLKRISVAEASGRAHCHGLGCFETRVFTDQGGYLWIASTYRHPNYGWTLIALDQNAALHNACFMLQALPVL